MKASSASCVNVWTRSFARDSKPNSPTPRASDESNDFQSKDRRAPSRGFSFPWQDSQSRKSVSALRRKHRAEGGRRSLVFTSPDHPMARSPDSFDSQLPKQKGKH